MRAVRQGSNIYCGPAVLSVLTGKTVDEIASILRYITGRREIDAISTLEIEAALKHMRYTFTAVAVDSSMYSLFMQIHSKDGFYLIHLPNHYAAIEVADKKVWFCDNHTKEPMNGASSARLGQRVNRAYKVELKPDPVLVREEIRLDVQKYISSIRVDIYRDKIYQVEEDNETQAMGSFQVRNEEELSRVKNQMFLLV